MNQLMVPTCLSEITMIYKSEKGKGKEYSELDTYKARYCFRFQERNKKDDSRIEVRKYVLASLDMCKYVRGSAQPISKGKDWSEYESDHTIVSPDKEKRQNRVLLVFTWIKVK